MTSIVITGAAGALGSTLLRHLAARGQCVAALDVPRVGDKLAELARELGSSCLPIPMDVTAAAAWTEALGRIERELGPVAGAALVAGGWQGGAAFFAEPDNSVFRAMFSINLETAERSLRALLPGMVARGAGSIVVVGSRAAERPSTSAGAAAYASSKAAVVALAQAIAAEVLQSGVRINAVLPSIIDTPSNRSAMPDADPSKWVSPQSLSEVIAFLLSESARDISGAAIPVYGRI